MIAHRSASVQKFGTPVEAAIVAGNTGTLGNLIILDNLHRGGEPV